MQVLPEGYAVPALHACGTRMRETVKGPLSNRLINQHVCNKVTLWFGFCVQVSAAMIVESAISGLQRTTNNHYYMLLLIWMSSIYV